LPENPLLPHRKLRELYTLMQHCHDLDKKHRSTPRRTAHTPREAVLAATSIHLLPGDLLCSEPGDLTTQDLAPASKSKHLLTGLFAGPSMLPRLPLCAAAARGLQATSAEALLIAYTRVGIPSPGWTTALEWAQRAQLPLLFTVIDPTAPRNALPKTAGSKEPSLSLPSITAFARKLRLPVMPVDGEDAVAVYRVMQESALRARLGGGPAVIWALMSQPDPSAALPRSRQPLARLQTYMSARKISLPR
jgi:hypothetical protein